VRPEDVPHRSIPASATIRRERDVPFLAPRLCTARSRDRACGVAAVPRRRAASSARTDSYTSGPLKRASKAVASSSTAVSRRECRCARHRPNLHIAAARPGHGSAHEQQMLVRPNRDDLETALGHALVAHLAGTRMPLKTRDGVADAPIDPGARVLCEPCVTGPRLKRWRLTVPGSPSPSRFPEDLDDLARCEHGGVYGVADASPAPSSRNSARWRSGGAEAFASGELGLRQGLLARRAKGELEAS